ncbi:MAG: hypothetical protein VZR09_06840 [Candidatus Gastranaerophilaceae bacterium]|nr:hypothetical protein [Candidatus Gastranaerophilaceae bacterium]
MEENIFENLIPETNEQEECKCKSILIKILKLPQNPIILAIISLILLYTVNFTPIVFTTAALIWFCYRRKFIDFKSLMIYATIYSFGQLFVNAYLVYQTGFIDITGFQFIALRMFGFFVLSFVLGSLMFYLANGIFYIAYKLLRKIMRTDNPE